MFPLRTIARTRPCACQVPASAVLDRASALAGATTAATATAPITNRPRRLTRRPRSPFLIADPPRFPPAESDGNATILPVCLRFGTSGQTPNPRRTRPSGADAAAGIVARGTPLRPGDPRAAPQERPAAGPARHRVVVPGEAVAPAREHRQVD